MRTDGWIENISPRIRYDSHRLIEELMILANVAAAETLHAKHIPVMSRIHAPPNLENIKSLRVTLAALGFNLSSSDLLHPRGLSDLLDRVAQTDKASIVNDLVLRVQSKAYYGLEESGHFGLALQRYCHFTSPIRRYADILIHRALIGTLHLGDDGIPSEGYNSLKTIGEQISASERRTAAAERDALDRFTSAYFSHLVGDEFYGRISGINRFGLFIRLEETCAEGFIPLRVLPSDYYHHNERQQNLRGDSTGLSFDLGQRILVRLIEADHRSASLVFEILGLNLTSEKNKHRRSRHKQRRRRRKTNTK